MFSKIGFWMGAALMLCAGVLRAAPTGVRAEIDSAQSGNPDSIEYRNRTIASHSPSNEEIEAVESANPDSVGYRDRMIVSSDPISADDWLALEFGNPDFR